MGTPEQWRQYYADKDRYERALIEYQARLQEWNSLTPDEKRQRNEDAEGQSRITWSLGIAAIVCWALYAYMRPKFSGDNFWLLWSGASIAIILIAVITSRVVGLLARATTIAGATAFVCYLIFERMQAKMVDPPSDEFQYWATGIMTVLAFFGGLLGACRATAEPRPPSAPTRPT